MSVASDIPGRRERKKARTRSALRAAATQLVAERGLNHVTIEAITDRVDVSARTFFNYFPTKEDALTAVDPERLSQLSAAILARPPEEPPLAAVRNVLVDTAAEWSEHRDEWLARIEVIQSEPRLLPALIASWSAFEDSIATAIRGRLPDADPLRAGAVAAAAVAIFRHAVTSGRVDEAHPLFAIVDAAFQALHETNGDFA